MKKHILSTVFALLAIFCLSPKAHAEEYCALGSYSAGEEMHCYITMVSSNTTVSAEGLPAGLQIVESPGGNGKHISLKGIPYTAGTLSFNLRVSEAPELIICSAEIRPATPFISHSGNIDCGLGDRALLEVWASSADGGSLSYQWYSGAGFAGTPIAGATGSAYKADTYTSGQYAYYCEVTNNNNGLTSSAVSDPIFVTVAEPKITGIYVDTLPAKLSYSLGEGLDTTGLSLRVSYDNGSSAVINQGFEASPTLLASPGRQLIELSYGGFRCSYYVEVAIDAASVEGIGVLTLPDKTEYKLGESLDITGLSIRAYTRNGQFDVSEGLEFSPKKFSEEGRQTVTVTYGGKSCSFTVTVKDEKSVDIASLPIRREYSVGDTLDTSGLSLKVVSGGKTSIVSSGFSCSPNVLTQAGSQTITVTYGEFTTSFSITVKEAAAGTSPSPTVRPSANPAPSPTPDSEVTATPAPSKAPAVRPEHQARDVGGLVKVIFIVAVVSLISLAGFVVYMQKKGKR